ncbi:hypothetical protein ROZALSC1DRAFT_22400 [Rozella allomycis CSF55]|uniref:PXA domain-containing protein n=1 Tax=Rozella allomycis (strain CSF55) TaxID=988480 RepID=A0A4P9YIT8_ROZAC|nr:hypothetical protein ROZALSC1DRAFT_22400 [Rozella allomycis CSF55]
MNHLPNLLRLHIYESFDVSHVAATREEEYLKRVCWFLSSKILKKREYESEIVLALMVEILNEYALRPLLDVSSDPLTIYTIFNMAFSALFSKQQLDYKEIDKHWYDLVETLFNIRQDYPFLHKLYLRILRPCTLYLFGDAIQSFLDWAKIVVRESTFKSGFETFCQSFENPARNRQLMIHILDLLLISLYPEISSPVNLRRVFITKPRTLMPIEKETCRNHPFSSTSFTFFECVRCGYRFCVEKCIISVYCMKCCLSVENCQCVERKIKVLCAQCEKKTNTT